MGDFYGRTADSEIVSRYGEEGRNDNNERLIEMCAQYNLKIWNGFFEHKDIHKYTWTQTTRRLKTIIDYVIGKRSTKLRIEDTRVSIGKSENILSIL